MFSNERWADSLIVGTHADPCLEVRQVRVHSTTTNGQMVDYVRYELRHFISWNILAGLKLRDETSNSFAVPFLFKTTNLRVSQFVHDAMSSSGAYLVQASSAVQDVWLRCHTRMRTLFDYRLSGV